MVIRVVPLCQLERGQARCAARHGEVKLKPLEGLEAIGDESQSDGPVRDVVVQGAISNADSVDAGRQLGLRRLLLYGVKGFEQLVGRDFPFPVPFKGFLELAVGADARIPKGLSQNIRHAYLPVTIPADDLRQQKDPLWKKGSCDFTINPHLPEIWRIESAASAGIGTFLSGGCRGFVGPVPQPLWMRPRSLP